MCGVCGVCGGGPAQMYVHDVRWFIGSLMERVAQTNKQSKTYTPHTTKNHTSAGGHSLIAYLNKFINHNN